MLIFFVKLFAHLFIKLSRLRNDLTKAAFSWRWRVVWNQYFQSRSLQWGGKRKEWQEDSETPYVLWPRIQQANLPA